MNWKILTSMLLKFSFLLSSHFFSKYSNNNLIIECNWCMWWRNLPQAAMAGILISTVIYVLANFSYFLILTPNEILARDAIALVTNFFFHLHFYENIHHSYHSRYYFFLVWLNYLVENIIDIWKENYWSIWKFFDFIFNCHINAW